MHNAQRFFLLTSHCTQHHDRSVAVNDKYVFFTGTLKSDWLGSELRRPNYYDEYTLVSNGSNDNPFIAIAYVSTILLASTAPEEG
jgi:hypothetical protein